MTPRLMRSFAPSTPLALRTVAAPAAAVNWTKRRLVGMPSSDRDSRSIHNRSDMEAWRVHKFGGSSVADAACMERVAGILENDPLPRVAAVLSACRGVTDALLALVDAAERHEDGDAGRLEAIRERHAGMARTLLGGPPAEAYIEELSADCRDIAGILQTVRLVRIASPVIRDLLAGYGEIWSTRLFTRYLQARGRRAGGVRWVDAREIVEIDAAPLGPSILWPESRANADRLIPRDPSLTLIITGFIARTRDGLQTTLGR